MQGDMSLSCPWNLSFLHCPCPSVPVPGDLGTVRCLLVSSSLWCEWSDSMSVVLARFAGVFHEERCCWLRRCCSHGRNAGSSCAFLWKGRNSGFQMVCFLCKCYIFFTEMS